MSTQAKPSSSHVRVGVGVLVKDPKDPSKVFAGKRKGSHGEGTLALPGGHLKMYEAWEECAAREVKEEMGIDIHKLMFGHVTNDPMKSEGKHYITIFMLGEFVDSEATPENCEPHKCEGWDSYSWLELEQIYNGEVYDIKLFGPLGQLVKEKPEQVILFMRAGIL